MVEQSDKGNTTTLLYSGPGRESRAVFPLGEFHLFAEIHEEFESFATFHIDVKFPTYMPEEEEYFALGVGRTVQESSDTGDQTRVAQLLQADVSALMRRKSFKKLSNCHFKQASIRAEACWFDFECSLTEEGEFSEFGDLNIDNMTESQVDKLNDMIRLLTQVGKEYFLVPPKLT